jgi:hypothetical protein
MAIPNRIYEYGKPRIGEPLYEVTRDEAFSWDGSQWVLLENVLDFSERHQQPSKKDLEEYPALKAAWEEFLIVKRLTGT